MVDVVPGSEADPNAHLHVEFYMGTRLNKRETAKQGRPIYDDREMVKIRIAGDKRTVHHAPAHEKAQFVQGDFGTNGRRVSYAERFPQLYDLFKKGQEQAVSGTPIEELPFLTEGNRQELKALSIYTVEALANLPDTSKIGMQGEQWKDLALAYLDRAEGLAQDTRLAAQNQAMALELADLKAQVARLTGAQQAPKETPLNAPAIDAEATEGIPEEVTKPGPFFGYDAQRLKAFIKEKSGHGVRGTPKLATLLEMAEDELEKAKTDA